VLIHHKKSGGAVVLREGAPRAVRRLRAQGGQSVLEFVLMGTALLLLVFGGLQMALILNAAVAVSEYSYVAARYAAIHGGGQPYSSYGSTIKTAVAPPVTICTSGFSGCASGTGLAPLTVTCTGCTGGNIVSGAQIAVRVTYNLSTSNKIFLPTSFFGFALPTSIMNTSSVMAE